MIYANPMSVVSEVLVHLHWKEWKVHEYHYGEKRQCGEQYKDTEFSKNYYPIFAHDNEITPTAKRGFWALCAKDMLSHDHRFYKI